jgi:acetoin utilization deacetylase AcuC-like enzyme
MLTIAYHPIYKHPLPEGHRFPMAKYELLPQQLLYEGLVTENQFFEPELPNLKYITNTHCPKYLADLLNLQLDAKHIRKIGFPLSGELVERELRIANGTIIGAQNAIKNQVSFNIAGGTHHAFYDNGEAFCLLNDQAIAANFLLENNLAKKILILDLDVHQGNGTAQIFQKNDKVFTVSVHGKSNYPFKKEISDIDIALEDNTPDEIYLPIIEKLVPEIIETQKPDFIFYLAGVDILATDKLGKLGCSLTGCKKRDQIVFENFKKYQIPVQVSMGGGYSPEIKTIIEAHANTYRVAKEILE